MNQQQPMGQKPPAVPRGLWITLIIIAVLGGFFVAWYLLTGQGKTAEKPTITATTTDPMADWLTYTNTTENYSIKYPKTWQYKVNGDKIDFSETGKTAATAPISITVVVNSESETLDAIVTKLSSTGTPVTMKLDTANALKIVINSVTKIAAVSGAKIYTLSSDATNLTTFNNMVKTFKFTTTTDLTYTNSTYGFTLTFPATWKGYKMKEANIPGETAIFYINMPTTDKSSTADTTADAGYFSPFAIGVYTLDEWATVESSGGPIGTLITKNDQYVFAWSPANGEPPSDWTLNDDIKKIIASFKLK